MNLEILGQNLAAWRELTGLTQAEVAQKTQIPRATLSLIELGRSKPSADHIEKLAKTFNIGLLDVVKPPRFRIEKIRFRSAKPMKSRTEILAFVTRKLATYAELEDLVGEHQDLCTIEAMSKIILQEWQENPELAAIAARKELKLDGEGSQGMIRDLCGLLEERAKVKILRIDLRNPDFFGLSVRDPKIGAAIVVNTWDRISIERQLFTLAHEFGHLLLHKSDYDPGAKEEESAIEDQANRFAGYFQMPTGLFEKEYREASGLSLFNRVLKIKKIFRVSYKTILYRLSDHYHKANIWKYFQVECKKNIGKTLSKVEEPFACTRLRAEECEELGGHDFIPDRMNRLVMKALEEDKISVSRAAETLEMDLLEFREHFKNVKNSSLEQVYL